MNKLVIAAICMTLGLIGLTCVNEVSHNIKLFIIILFFLAIVFARNHYKNIQE